MEKVFREKYWSCWIPWSVIKPDKGLCQGYTILYVSRQSLVPGVCFSTCFPRHVGSWLNLRSEKVSRMIVLWFLVGRDRICEILFTRCGTFLEPVRRGVICLSYWISGRRFEEYLANRTLKEYSVTSCIVSR